MSLLPEKSLAASAVMIFAGVILTGPPLVLLVHWLHPQPPWTDVDTLIEHFHWLQTLPYWFGFLLLAGNVLFVAAAGRLPGMPGRIRVSISLVAMAIYGTLVTINYATQVAWMPQAATLSPSLVAAFSMVNPQSIAWVLEMFAYAFAGIGMWLVARAFHGTAVRNTIRRLLVINGIVSVAGAVISAMSPSWVLSSWGLLAYVAWNALLLTIAVLVFLTFRMRRVTVKG